MKKTTQLYIIDVLLAISFLVAGITGVLKMPNWFSLNSEMTLPLMKLHDLSGMIMVGLVLVHLIQHWKWIVTMTKKLLFGDEKSKKISIIVIAVILTLIVSLIAIKMINNHQVKSVETIEVTTEVEAGLHSETPQYKNVKTGGCPYGIHNDPLPGLCTLYKDNNHNGECDYGE